MSSDGNFSSQKKGHALLGDNAPPPSANKPVVKSNKQAAWHGNGSPVVIHGISIENPMSYVGFTLKTMYEGDDPSLVDPDCCVSTAPSFDINALGATCSYRGFSNHQRLAYLNWLAGGRVSPTVPKDFLMVFFYGLERRVMIDSSRHAEAREEWPEIVVELTRLVNLHRHNRDAFHEKAIAFLNWLELAGDPPKIYLQEPQDSDVMKRPLRLLFALSQVARDRVGVPAWLALAMVRSESGFALRNAAKKCPDFFDLHFKCKYRESFESGIFLKKSNRPLEYLYRAASPALSTVEGVLLAFGNMVEADVSAVVVTHLKKIVSDTISDLDGYARAIGHDMEKVGTFDALVNLPVNLWEHDDWAFKEIHAIQTDLKSGVVITTLQEALERFGNDQKQPVREKLRSWARALEYFGIGVVPDLLLASKPIAMTDPVAFYSIQADSSVDLDVEHQTTALLAIDVAMLVAMSDPCYSDLAVDRLVICARQMDGICPSKWVWLEANARCAQRKVNTLTGLKKRLANVSQHQKETFTTLALQSLAHQQDISPLQMKSLEKLHVALSIDEKKLFERVHAISTGSSIRQATEKLPDFSLDADRIAELHRDTASVSGLLSEIFQEDDVVALTVASDLGILGLDKNHSAMAQALLARSQWPLDDLKNLAQTHGLFVDGAMETINEASYDCHGIPFTEGDDPVDVNPDILEFLT